jgi:hypothetical protein
MNTVLLNSKLVPKSNIMLRPQEFMMKTNNNYNKIGQDKVLKIEVNQHQKEYLRLSIGRRSKMIRMMGQ